MVLRDASASKNENNSLIDLNPLLYLNQMIHFFTKNAAGLNVYDTILKQNPYHLRILNFCFAIQNIYTFQYYFFVREKRQTQKKDFVQKIHTSMVCENL